MPKVLVIDDDSDMREMLRFLLSQSHYDVLLAADGLEGLRLAWEQHPDVILLDVMMPTMDGHQVLQRLKVTPETAPIPVIMLTAVSTARSVQQLISHGAASYVVKPFQPFTLVERVQKVLAKATAPVEGDAPGGAGSGEALFVIAHKKQWERDLLSRYLAGHGHVITTSNGLEALDTAVHSSPRALFLSDDLDELSGTALVERLRQSQPTAGTYLVGLLGEANDQAEKMRLLAAGFDEVLTLPAQRSAVAKVLERAAMPRASFTRVRDGVVVLAVISLDTANAIRRLRDAMLDLLEARFARFIIDLSYAQGAGQAITVLWPFFASLAERGIGLRLVSNDSAVRSFTQGKEGQLGLYSSVDEAIAGWA